MTPIGTNQIVMHPIAFTHQCPANDGLELMMMLILTVQLLMAVALLVIVNKVVDSKSFSFTLSNMIHFLSQADAWCRKHWVIVTIGLLILGTISISLHIAANK